jgi:hypothetical protein
MPRGGRDEGKNLRTWHVCRQCGSRVKILYSQETVEGRRKFVRAGVLCPTHGYLTDSVRAADMAAIAPKHLADIAPKAVGDIAPKAVADVAPKPLSDIAPKHVGDIATRRRRRTRPKDLVVPAGHKWCPECGLVLPLDEEHFTRRSNPKQGGEWYSKCRTCTRTMVKASKKRRKEKRKAG